MTQIHQPLDRSGTGKCSRGKKKFSEAGAWVRTMADSPLYRLQTMMVCQAWSATLNRKCTHVVLAHANADSRMLATLVLEMQNDLETKTATV